MEERTRIARELHDTLLQSFQGSLLVMQTARNLLSRRPEQAGETLDSAINMASDAIAEGRDAIQDLRSQLYEWCPPVVVNGCDDTGDGGNDHCQHLDP
jgi:signal transduction histidine kinase